MDNRRPLKIRSQKFVQTTARWLSKKDVTPNQISIASIAFSALASFILLFLPLSIFNLWMWAFLIIVCFIARGACNIFDGMVAVEGGKSTRSGELFNDIPDRISDVIILISAGYACGFVFLGWFSALMAVFVAYIRTLARGVGAPSDFQGPMAKIHRMIAIAVGVMLTPLEAIYFNPGHFIAFALIVVITGSLWTAWKRAKTAYDFLENQNV